MKKIFIFIFLIITLSIRVYANENDTFEDIYQEQLKLSDANKLPENLPKETLDFLSKIGVSGANWKEISNLCPDKIFGEVMKIFNEKIFIPLPCIISAIAVILVCSIINSFKDLFNNNPISKIMSSIGTLVLCISIITPILKCINHASLVIKSASNFTFCMAPIMASIMIASGNPVSATSYQTLVFSLGQVISHLSGNFLGNFLSILLGISIISSITSRINLENLCNTIYKSTKSILKFSSSIFVGIVTLQNLVTSSADNIGTSTIKFTIDSCVPIVGGALSDAFTTVQGCMKLLKSGVGAFGIIAWAVIFLPILTECIVWNLFLNFGTTLSDIFELKKISSLFKSVSNIISIILASILCVMMILIVSTVILLLTGR